MFLWPQWHFLRICWCMALETFTLQGCSFHWWKSSCCHLAKVSLPSCLLTMPVLRVLLPPLFIAGNRINHTSFYISVRRITSLSLVSLTLLADATLFCMAVLVNTEHFWSLKLFNSVVILQFKWQAMRVQSPIISSLYAVVHPFNVWKAVGSWMWNEQNNSQCLAGDVHKMSVKAALQVHPKLQEAHLQRCRLGDMCRFFLNLHFQKPSCFLVSLLWQVNCVAFLYFSNVKQSEVTLRTRCNSSALWGASTGI